MLGIARGFARGFAALCHKMKRHKPQQHKEQLSDPSLQNRKYQQKRSSKMQTILQRAGSGLSGNRLIPVKNEDVGEEEQHLKPLLSDVEKGSKPVQEGTTKNGKLSSGGTTAGTQNSDASKRTKALSSCLLYSFCSVSMILVNKSLVTSYNHLIPGNLNILLVVVQSIVAIISCEFSKYMGWIEYPSITMETTKQWAPVNVFFCGMLFTGMASLQTNSVPMVTVFKNVTNVITTLGDWFFFGNRPEALVGAAFGVMLVGAVAAASNDITVSATGLFWMLANCLCTAGYVLYMKFATQHVKLTKFGMVLINNILCTVFLLPVALASGEVSLFLSTKAIHTIDYGFKNVSAGLVGFFLNFASLNCVQATGPTTYAIVGSLNKIPVALLGYTIFDNAIDWETWIYISVSLCGGFLYSYAKIQADLSKNGPVRKN